MSDTVEPGDILLVAHFHWDREWYRSFEVFRSRLVDAIDAVLDLCDEDPDFRFVLDGQAIVLDDYVLVRPDRAPRIRELLAAGRLTAGPWYVQPDSLLPGGEAHVRNLLLGRAIAGSYGPVSRVAYVPDSFGHPAQFPQLFAGFGLGPFVYWRGNGGELDDLGGPGARWRWVAPDGTAIAAWHLGEGYFGAAALDADGDAAATADRLVPVVERLAASGGTVVLMQGFDHLPPDRTTPAVAAALAERTGRSVRRAVLDDLRAIAGPGDAPEHAGPLVGARVANLLPGVWSSRMPLKLRNRRIETLLSGWLEPWAAFGAALGGRDERASIDAAWRALVQNQAHDSIGGCSTDPVHEEMTARYDTAEGLGTATLTRVLERLAGRDDVRNTPWQVDQKVTVFNPSPHRRALLARVRIEAFPPWRVSAGRFDAHPLEMAGLEERLGFTVDGTPARVLDDPDPARVRFLGTQRTVDVEFVAPDVPAFGCRTFSLQPGDAVLDERDGGTEIGTDDGTVRVVAATDGTLAVTIDGTTYPGCFGIEDAVDRGDSYDADTDAPRECRVVECRVERVRHSTTGIASLRVHRQLMTDGEAAPLTLTVTAVVAPGVPYVATRVHCDNTWRDHRLRLRFPSGAPATTFTAASTFDHATHPAAPEEPTGWCHPAPTTVPHQGWVACNGLVVGAPGLPEAEVAPAGDILVTLVRSVGYLARLSLRSRPLPAGPEMPAPGAQVAGQVVADVCIARRPRDVRDAEVGSHAVLGGPVARLTDGHSLLALDGDDRLEITACKPPETGDGLVVRVLNPTDDRRTATLRFGLPVASVEAVRIDEKPVAGSTIEHRDGHVTLEVPPHRLSSVRVRFVTG